MNTDDTDVQLDSNKIAILEKKLQKIKSISDETAKHLFDAVNRGRRLAQSLGFNDVYDAQFAIDSFDHDISLRECYDRLHRQDDQLSTQKKEITTLETKLHNAEEKLKGLQAELEARTSDSRPKSTESSLRERLRRLNEQYDALKDVKERAAERYKADFKKWRAFNDWLFSEDTEHHKHRSEPGITREEKAKRDMTSIMRKKQKMIEIGPDLARFEGEPEDGNQALTNLERPPPLGRVEMDSDKENEGTPVPPLKKRRISSTPASEDLTSFNAQRQNKPPPTLTPPAFLRSGLLKSVTNMAAPSSSPTVFLGASMTRIGQSSTSRVPLTFQPIISSLHVKGAPSSTPSPVNTNKSSAPSFPVVTKRSHMPNSSDTEDDSQAICIPISGTPGVFKVPAPPQPSNPLKTGPIHHEVLGCSIQPQLATPSNMDSTRPKLSKRSSPNVDAEDKLSLSQVSLSGVSAHPSLPCRPAFASSSTKEDIHMKARLSLAEPMRNREPTRETSRPTKIRRLSGNEFGSSGTCTPRSETDDVADATSMTKVLIGEGVISTKDKGKSRKVQNGLATPATTRTSGQKCIEDYSAFKGRGRYGHTENQLGDTTINAQYTIDRDQNEGLNYQYDSVVRNRDERRRLEAGDCECCREYYKEIGPLPSRLQPPLWRSPPATPAKSCLRQSHSHSPEGQHPPGSRMQSERLPQTRDLHHQLDTESHKKAISRHRHTWARANTPPGYWDIGFPDTQAVGDINEKAEKMHERKKAEIDKEAGNEAGRYRRR